MNELTPKPLLVICGPTGTGKTSLAIRLAKRFNGEVISADARQVYKHLVASTGKEYSQDVPIWGYDLIEPTDSFSVSQYISFAREKITDIHSWNKLPILTGGTGFYIKGVVDGIETAQIAPNVALRRELVEKSVEDLFLRLQQKDPSKASTMNESDRRNPRRLIRAIEIASSDAPLAFKNPAFDVLEVGLTATLPFLLDRVEKRIESRFPQTITEVDSLLSLGVTWTDPVMSTLGVHQLKDLYEGKIQKGDAIKLWKREERKYVKRQLTWFNKDPRIHWFDIEDPAFIQKVEHSVEKWQNKG